MKYWVLACLYIIFTKIQFYNYSTIVIMKNAEIGNMTNFLEKKQCNMYFNDILMK